MLILLPPSESKTAPSSGPAVDLAELSHPELTDAREAMLDRLIEVSSADDAADLLGTGPSLAAEVERNTRLRSAPSAPALSVYTGVLYDALAAASLSPEARARAEESILIVSALWGVVSPADMIPAYRLSMGAKIAPKGTLAAWWRGELKPVLDRRASGDVIVDCRSSSYAAAWKAPADSTALIRVERDTGGRRQVVSHMAKHFRGEAARLLVESGQEPQTLDDVVDILKSQWKVEIGEPTRTGVPVTLVLPADQ